MSDYNDYLLLLTILNITNSPRHYTEITIKSPSNCRMWPAREPSIATYNERVFTDIWLQ